MAISSVREALSNDLSEIAKQRGFQPIALIPLGTLDGSSFVRSTVSRFRSELLCFYRRSKPRTELLPVVVASHLSDAVLRERGLEGNAVLDYPFDFQVLELGLPKGQLLPKEILLAGVDWSSTKVKLMEEILRIDPRIFESLWKRWQSKLPTT